MRIETALTRLFGIDLPIVQAGARSRGFRGPLWSEQEARLRHFHAELDRKMGEGA